MKIKNLMTALLASALVVGAMTVSAMAATVATIGEVKYDTVQEAVDAVANGETIVLKADVPADAKVTVNKTGVAFTIDGNDVEFEGYISINIGQTLTVKNVSFVHKGDANHDFIKNEGSPTGKNYNTTLTVENCSFTGNRAVDTVAVRTIHPTHTQILNCTATGLHSVLQNTGGQKVTVDNVTVTNSKSGFALGGVRASAVKNCAIDVDEHGVRIDAATANANHVVESCEISAFIPVVVRKATAENVTLTIGGDNTITASNTDGIWCAVGITEYEENGKLPTTSEIDVEVVVTDTDLDKSGLYGGDVAMFNGESYRTLKEAIVAAANGGTITLIAGVNEGSIKLPAVIKDLVIDGNGFTVKNTVINAADGGSVDYQGFTVKNTVFDNSRFVLGGQRSGNVIYKDLVFTGNTFKNIVAGQNMSAVHMNLASEDNEYVENFTFTGNTIDGVTGSANNGVLMKSAKGNIVFTNNTIVNVVNNAIQCINAKSDIKLVITDNIMEAGGSAINLYNVPAATLANNLTPEGEPARVGNFNAVAKIGDKQYTTLVGAIADAKDGDTVTLLNDVTFEDVLLYADRNGKTWNGSYAFDIRVTKDITLDLAGYILKSTGGSDLQHYAIICVDGKGDLTIIDSSSEKTGAIVNATTSRPAGKMSVVLYNEAGDITLDGGTYSNQARADGNYPYVIDSITAGDTSLVINDGVKLVSDGYMTLRAMSQGGGGTQNVTINGGEFEGGIWVVLKNGGNDVMSFTVSDGTFNATNALIIENYAAPADGSTADSVSITGGTFNGKVGIGQNNVGGLLADGFISGGIYVNDVSEYTTAGLTAVEQYEGKYVIIDESLKVEAIEVKLVEVTENVPEGEKLYNINLVATDDDIINRLNSADLTFEISNTTGKTAFEIVTSNDEVVINPVNNSTVRYEFHFEDKDAGVADTAKFITIGQVKFNGYGIFSFEVDADAETNAAHATKLYDNIVDTFIPDGDTTKISNGELVIDNAVINTEILVPTRDLVINIAFPNAVENKIAAYQQMKVTVSGGDLEEALVVELGENGAITDLAVYATKTSADKAVDAVFANDAYKLTVTDLLTVNTAYTVTVEGAGYRTYRYTVTMTGDKTLNFWNNVKDNDTVVEKDKKTEKVTYLAGDIVKDSLINVYDLSAVVSYFGETELVGNNNTYAKYDLNRDGKIDSKDVAYVLVSWGK